MYNKQENKIKGKIPEHIQNKIIQGRIKLIDDKGNNLQSWWFYQNKQHFFKDYWLSMLNLTDNYLWKFVRLYNNMDWETNRIDLKYYWDQLFEWKTRKAKYEFIKELKDQNAIRQIDWFRYINPHIINSRNNIEVWSKQDKILKAFK